MKTKARKKPQKRKAASTPKDAAPDAQGAFEKGIMTRAEAAELTPEGKLPQHATHAILKKADGTRVLKRARFKLF
ncbi:MAG TPA: hypothetical protein VGF59_27395 [Bryobacteraceae bacterium]|jgi:hypothetical protein